MLSENKELNNEHELSFAGKIIKVSLSILLAGYIAKKLVKKYPGNEIPKLAKGVGGFLLVFSVAVMVLLFVAALIYGVYDLFNPEPESIIQAAQRRLKERGG